MLIKIIILFIYTFLENTKYLKICVKIFKVLLSKSLKKTVHQNFQKLHNEQKTIFIQLTKIVNNKKIKIFVKLVY